MNIRALLELCRISNLPTVWSNATVGSLAGYLAWLRTDTPNHEYHIPYLLNHPEYLIAIPFAPALIISMLYCAGMVLNDYWDRHIDAKERPQRPIPSGRVSLNAARNLVMWLIFGAVIFPLIHAIASFLSSTSPETQQPSWAGLSPLASVLILLFLIVAYNRIHSGNRSAIFLMALCRVFAIVTAGVIYAPIPNTVYWWLFIVGPAVSVGVYTLAISIVARREVEPGGFGGPKTVMNMIAAMPLLDAIWLIAMGLWPASLFCVACAGMTKLAHRKVAGS